MNFKYYLIIPIILFLSNCSTNVNLKKFTTVENFSNKGFTLVFEDKYGKIVDYKPFGDGYIAIGFSEGFICHISTYLKE